MTQDALPKKGQRWRKKGTKTSEVLVTAFHEGQEGPVSFGPMVFVDAPVGLHILPLEEFLAEYEGPLPELDAHDERVEYVPLIDPPDERVWGGKRRLKVRVEGRGANRVVTIDKERGWPTIGPEHRWKNYGDDTPLCLAPDEARLLAAALTKVLRREGDADV